jgi:hypothetical protein
MFLALTVTNQLYIAFLLCYIYLPVFVNTFTFFASECKMIFCSPSAGIITTSRVKLIG